MELGLHGKRAVVTGSTRGIGRAIAEALHGEGVDVLLCGVQDTVDATVEQFRARDGGNVYGVRADLGTTEGIERVVAAAREHLAGVDVLVNCAGGEPFGSLDTFDEDRWRRAFDIKLWGYVKLTKAAFDIMREHATSGSIINITGSGGTLPQSWYPAGALTCAGLNAFTRSVAQHGAAFAIRVNAISPHYIATERLDDGFAAPAQPGVPSLDDMRGAVGAGRMGTTREVADVALFLASDRSSFVNGAIIDVDGATGGLMATTATDWASVFRQETQS